METTVSREVYCSDETKQMRVCETDALSKRKTSWTLGKEKTGTLQNTTLCSASDLLPTGTRKGRSLILVEIRKDVEEGTTPRDRGGSSRGRLSVGAQDPTSLDT